jgi:hypothetical protein
VSFLLRRHVKLAWAGWYDNFQRPAENPVKQPWGHFGDGSRGYINSDHELVLPANYSSLIGGGESYEFQPFTSTFGHEWTMWWPVEGLAAQYFNDFVMENWSKIGPSFANSFCIRCRHAPVLGADDIQIIEFDGLMSSGTILAEADIGGSFFGRWITIRVHVDDDKLVRVWVNDVPKLQAVVSAGHRPHKDKRGLNFFNNCLADARLKAVGSAPGMRIFDRPSDFPILAAGQWSQIFYDDFGRADGAVGNGWTQLGTDAAIRSNSWATINTTDGNRAILRESGNLNGAQRVEAVIGGFQAPTSTPGFLVLRANSAGTAGLLASFRNGGVVISRFTSSLGGTSLSGSNYVSDTIGTIPNGTLFAFCANGDYAWIEIGGAVVLKCQLFGGPTGSWMGAHVSRGSGANSASWNSIRLMEAA